METEMDAAGAPDAPLSLPAAVADTLSGMINTVAEVERAIASLTALRAELLQQAADWNEVSVGLLTGGKAGELHGRAFRAEVACALRIPERTAENLIGTSRYLARLLPATMAALREGEISYRHAQLLVDNTAGLDDEATAALETAALPHARKLTASKFERKVRTLREKAMPDTITERRVKAVGDREVEYLPGRDGMASLIAYLPAPEALGIFHRLTDIGRGLQTAEEDRTLTQLRADVFCDLLLDGEPTEGARGIRPTVFVTVPVLTLLGLSEEPAILDGYGPIDAETARYLAAQAPSFIRLLTHPETGAVLSVGRDSYRVPADLRHWLRVRDGTCRFPGCSRPARHCDVDHTEDWHACEGETCHDNLAHLCKGHHTLKHNTDWTVSQTTDGSGTLNWVSPAGLRYTTEPETRMSA